MNCCDRPNKCQRGRDCPTRIKRIREAKRLLDRDQLNIPLLLLGRLPLGGAILLVILVGVMLHDTLRAAA